MKPKKRLVNTILTLEQCKTYKTIHQTTHLYAILPTFWLNSYFNIADNYSAEIS